MNFKMPLLITFIGSFLGLFNVQASTIEKYDATKLIIENLTIKTTQNPCYSWGDIITFYTEIEKELTEVAYIEFENKNKSIYVHRLLVHKKFRNQQLGVKIIAWFKQFAITKHPNAQSINWIAAPIDPDAGEKSAYSYKRLYAYYQRQNATVIDGHCRIKLKSQTLWDKLFSAASMPKSRL